MDADLIDALLPQTQCERCGFPGCRPYAEAIATGHAPINQCPPGGAATIAKLAALLQADAIPLNPAHGAETPPQVALIDEARCIGCAKCLPPCPVDAIIGAPRYMHTVITAVCTGCELCIAPCPADCITMVALETTDTDAPGLTSGPDPKDNRSRYRAHNQRTASRAAKRATLLDERKRLATRPAPT